MNSHYQNIQRFTAKALSHGVDSEETEQLIREEAINKYIETQRELAVEEYKNKK